MAVFSKYEKQTSFARTALLLPSTTINLLPIFIFFVIFVIFLPASKTQQQSASFDIYFARWR